MFTLVCVWQLCGRCHAWVKKKYFKFSYGVNFKYEGMLSHSFDRFYIVTKFELPKIKGLRLATFKFDFECSYANHTSSNTNYPKLLKYCMKITPYAWLYQRQIQYYKQTAYDTLTNDIGKILPKFPTDDRQKCGAILASILGSVASKVIGLAYEGISSFLHHKRHKALHKAVAVMNKMTDVQCKQNTSFRGHYDYVWCIQFRYFERPYRYSTWNAQFYYLEQKDFHRKIAWLDGDLFSRWRRVQLCHKFCTISDYSMRKICENVWKIYWGTEIIL